MTLGAFFIFAMSLTSIHYLEKKYWRPGEDRITVEEFIYRASLDDILRHRYHAITGWIAMGIMTIASTMH